MDLRLQFLESFRAEGPDGQSYKVSVFERLARDESSHVIERWEPTGMLEYHLQDGRLVEEAKDGTLRVPGTSLELRRVAKATSA
jgi:hypothetical protein